MPFLCHAFGLLVATELDIPGAIPAGNEASGQPAFRVEHGVAWGLSGSTGRRDGPYRVVEEGLLFEKQEVARYLCCRDGKRLVVDVEPEAEEADIAAYLIATAIPALLWMRGEILLHGALAVLPGMERAIGIVGSSGSGKSRLLKEIAEAGGSVAAEDSFRVWHEGPHPMAAGLPGLIHERAEGAALHVRRSEWMVPPDQQRVSAELSAVVVLRDGLLPRADGEGSAENPVRLGKLDAFEAILLNRHRVRVPDLLGLSGVVLPRCGALAAEVPVYSWEFLQAASRSTGEGSLWRKLAGL